MKIVAIIGNAILFGFTCLVLVVDGLPRGAGYVVLTLLALLVPILNSAALARPSMGAAR